MSSDDELKIRLPSGLKRRFKQRAHDGMTDPMVQFVRWYLRVPGARLPQRPPGPDSPDLETP